ncbi:hypothetical protein [Streptomyces sp. NPDC001404]|uniref:hypothetical protein n=1 Tax=Streptomyces sp. NPDC001404 TaxID=3364571 RepID=UPI0036BDA5B6
MTQHTQNQADTSARLPAAFGKTYIGNAAETEYQYQAADFEALGIRFTGSDPDDPQYVLALLPEGWSQHSEAHSGRRYVLDQHGRPRAMWYVVECDGQHPNGSPAKPCRICSTGGHLVGWMELASPRNYVKYCAQHNRPIITDRTWATPEAVRDALLSWRDMHQEEAKSLTSRLTRAQYQYGRYAELLDKFDRSSPTAAASRSGKQAT